MGTFIQNTVIPSDGTIVEIPVDRDPKSIITQGLVDPVHDIDRRPLTFSGSRRCTFIYRADEKDLKRLLPEPLTLEDDVVEFAYVEHTMSNAGPFVECIFTVAASCNGIKGGFMPTVYVPSDSAIFAGREFNGTPKKNAYITILEHGDKLGYKRWGQEKAGRRFFSFMIERNGYLLHTATGEYTGNKIADLPRLPVFYGKKDWVRFSFRVTTEPDLSKTTIDLVSTGAGKGGTFQMKPWTIDVAQAKDIRTWAMQASPWDNMGAVMPAKELIGLISYSFDRLYPPAQSVIWSREISRTPEEIAKYCTFGEPYRYSMRHNFPKPVGA
jgi:hypothetical protein